MFILEIDGVMVAVTDADEGEARELFESAEFKADLAQFTTDGRPVWTPQSRLVVRPVSEDEAEDFLAAFEEADFADDEDDAVDEAAAGEEDEEFDGEGPSVMFLVPIDQLDEEA